MRRSIYFSQGGELNAVRWNDWKVNFAVQRRQHRHRRSRGSRLAADRQPPGRPLREGAARVAMYMRWYADNIWLFVPVQQKVKQFFADFAQYPNQPGTSLNAGNINYGTLQALQAMKRLKELETLRPPSN